MKRASSPKLIGPRRAKACSPGDVRAPADVQHLAGAVACAVGGREARGRVLIPGGYSHSWAFSQCQDRSRSMRAAVPSEYTGAGDGGGRRARRRPNRLPGRHSRVRLVTNIQADMSRVCVPRAPGRIS